MCQLELSFQVLPGPFRVHVDRVGLVGRSRVLAGLMLVVGLTSDGVEVASSILRSLDALLALVESVGVLDGRQVIVVGEIVGAASLIVVDHE